MSPAGTAGVVPCRSPRSSGVIVSSLLGAFLGLLIATALTVCAHVLVALGMYPESVSSAETTAPLLGLAVGGLWAARRTQRRPVVVSLGVAAVLVLLWFAQWLFLAGRGDPRLWWRQALPALTIHHLVWWAAALAVGVVAGVVGGRLRERSRWVWAAVAAAVLAALAAGMQIAAVRQRAAELPFGEERTLAPGVTITSRPPQRDGTIVRLLSFDFAQNPRLRLRLYDADSDDADPWDDLNTSWLAKSLTFVLDHLRRRTGLRRNEILCLVNAGFFNLGPERCLLGSHVAPIVVDGEPRYRVRRPAEDEWTFGMSVEDDAPRFRVAEGMRWDELRGFDIAIGHVRPLRMSGRSPRFARGPGIKKRKCSRTSVGWSPDSRRFFVLVVHDPGAEIPGILKRHAPARRQVGGWTLSQIQWFWQRMGVGDAVLLDGGDSTNLAYRSASGRYVIISSGYLLSRTLAYLRGRPLRVFVPSLPAAQSHVGVMNYLYVEAAERDSVPR